MTCGKIELGSVAKVLNGYAFKSKEYVDNGIRIVRITNVQKGCIEDDNPKFIDGSRSDEFARFMLGDGDILLSLTGNVGRVGIIEKPMLPAALNQRVGALKIESNIVKSKYLFHILNSDNFEREAIKNSKGIAQLNLSSKWVEKYQIPLPPLAEQKRIAGILDAADALRAKRRESLAQLDILLQSTFLDMFGDPVTNPMGWKVVSAANVFAELTYGTSTKASEQPSSGSSPALRIPNVIGGQVDWADLKFVGLPDRERTKLLLKRDDLLFVRTNGNPDYIGRCARFDGSREAVFASYLIRGRLRESAGLQAEFLKHVIEYPSYRHKVRREARTTAGNFNLSTAGIRKFLFLKPPLDLQHRFAAIVESVEQQKARLRAHLAELDALFASLQSRAFNGEL